MADKTPLKSKPPKGLKVARNGNTFTFSWTAGEAYKDVDLKIRVGTGKKTKKGKAKYVEFKYKAGAKDLKKNKITIKFPYKYKKGKKKITVTPKTFVNFTCRGLAKRKLTDKEKKKHNKLTESNYAKGWGKFPIETASKPSMSATWDSSTDNKTAFSWSVPNADKTNKKWCIGHKWRTGVRHEGDKSISWGNWNNRNDASWGYSTPEADLAKYTSTIRYVQAFAKGQRANSASVSKNHVYAQPKEPTDLKFTSVTEVKGGLNVKFQWSHNGSFWHPIDYTETQYAVSPPAKGMNAPKNLSGTKISNLPAKSPTKTYTDSDAQELDKSLEENECLFARVRFVHDNRENYSYWRRSTQLVSNLSSPTLDNLQPVVDNILSVEATNSAAEAVEDSFLAISYKTIDSEMKSSTPQVIGIIPNGETSLNVRIPDDLGAADIQVIGVQAIAYAFQNSDFKVIPVAEYIEKMPGDTPAQKVEKVFGLLKSDLYVRTGNKDNYQYTKVTSQPYDATATYCAYFYLDVGVTGSGKTYKEYTLPSLTNANSMKSEQLWEEGEFPKPPTGFNVVSADINTTAADTAKASWNWNWSQATSIELAYADHSDAWESTDEPTLYRVPVERATSWNIKGLSAGTVWYFRARFIRETVDSEIVGPWSTMVDLNLTSAPVAPVLTLSRNVVTEDQDFVASWVYTSVDGSPQDKAQIFLVTTDANGERRGTYKPAADVLLKDGSGVPIFDIERIYYTKSIDPETLADVYTVVQNPVEIDLDNYYLFDDKTALVQTESGSTVQQMTLTASGLNLKVGETYYLSLRLSNKTGGNSEWSPKVELRVAEPLAPPVISAISQITPSVVTNYINGSDYFLTQDVTVSENKSYYTLEGTVVDEPIVDGIDFYYELSGEVYFKTTDTEIVEGKTYYTVESNSVYEPVDEDLGIYYELTVTEEYDARLTLTALPVELNITGAGANGTTMVTIERTNDFFTDAPDETVDRGYTGEIVALVRQPGEDPIIIDQTTLIGDLDDGAPYKINVTIVDENGQTASEEYIQANVASADDFARWKDILYTRIFTEEKTYQYIIVSSTDTYDPLTTYYFPNEFVVAWNHQPTMPIATVEPDNDRYVMKITPGIEDPTYVPEPGDVIDIYRLSVDKPQLIYENAIAGQTYVDPYPAFGEFGGHRVVYKTNNGDYVVDTPQGKLNSWIDLDEEQGDIIETPYSVLNFADGTVEVLYNINLSSNWKKDFQETRYLGGSVQGDWTPGVSRTGTISTVSVITQDQDTIKQIRRLADYAGIVHVRTRDGSSFAANVDVSETMDYNSYDLVSYSLSFTRVDSEGLDGMTLQEWERLIANEES